MGENVDPEVIVELDLQVVEDDIELAPFCGDFFAQDREKGRVGHLSRILTKDD